MTKNRKQITPPKLVVELVPATCWYSNLRDILTQQQWDFLRNRTYRLNNYHCEVCKGRGNDHPVECHEKWEYDDKNKIQKLVGLYALCPACHYVKHIGLRDKGPITRQHIQKVNNWNSEQTEEHISKAWDMWFERNAYEWKLDITWLEQFGIKVVPKRNINNKICNDLSAIDTGGDKVSIHAYPNMNTFGNFYQAVKERHALNNFLDNINRRNTIFLALNTANFHWVLAKITKESGYRALEYYDPEKAPIPKALQAMLEDLLQSKLQISVANTNVSTEARKDGSWIYAIIQELITIQQLLSTEPEPTTAKKSGHDNHTHKFLSKKKSREKLPEKEPAIKKSPSRKSKQDLYSEMKRLLS